MGYNQGKPPRGSQAVEIQTNMAEAGEAFGNIAGTLAKKYYSEEMRKPRLEKRANRADEKADKLRARSKRLFGTTTSDDGVTGPTGGRIGKNNNKETYEGISKLKPVDVKVERIPENDPEMVPYSSNDVMPGGAEMAKAVMNSFSKDNKTEAADNRMEAAELNQGVFDKIMGLNMTAPDAFAKGMKRKARYTK